MSNVTTWRYHLGNSSPFEGWAIVFLDSIGIFSVVSDWGEYGHRWPENGWSSPTERDFRQAFLSMHDEYILRKIARRDTYYNVETVRAVKSAILEARRHGSWKRDRARDEWDLIARFENLYSAHDFAQWYERTTIDDAYELAHYDVSHAAKGFMEHVMPRLREAIRAELAAEGKAA